MDRNLRPGMTRRKHRDGPAFASEQKKVLMNDELQSGTRTTSGGAEQSFTKFTREVSRIATGMELETCPGSRPS